MHQAKFHLNTHRPYDEIFTSGMRDMVLHHAPPSTFDSLMAILAPYVECPINEPTTMMASLGEAESKWQAKYVSRVRGT